MKHETISVPPLIEWIKDFLFKFWLINLKVELVEQLGSDNLVYGQIKNIKDFCYRSPGNQTIKKGGTLSLNIEENKYYIFDKSTGKRVN